LNQNRVVKKGYYIPIRSSFSGLYILDSHLVHHFQTRTVLNQEDIEGPQIGEEQENS
jgi:hypothetical protein